MKPRSKYGNRWTEVDGLKFQSAAEARRWSELRLLERAGEIDSLKRQPQWQFSINGNPVLIRSKGYPNGRQAGFKADFSYWEKGEFVVEDVKGGQATQTEAYKLRKAIVEAMHPTLKIREVGA